MMDQGILRNYGEARWIFLLFKGVCFCFLELKCLQCLCGRRNFGNLDGKGCDDFGERLHMVKSGVILGRRRRGVGMTEGVRIREGQ